MRTRIALACLAGLAAWSAVTHPWGWAYGIGVHPYPASSSTPWTYQLLSGFVPALTVLGLLTFVAGAWHHVNCHREDCWRIGRHRIDGTPWCNHHVAEARQAHTDEHGTIANVIERLDYTNRLLEALAVRFDADIERPDAQAPSASPGDRDPGGGS